MFGFVNVSDAPAPPKKAVHTTNAEKEDDNSIIPYIVGAADNSTYWLTAILSDLYWLVWAITTAVTIAVWYFAL